MKEFIKGSSVGELEGRKGSAVSSKMKIRKKGGIKRNHTRWKEGSEGEKEKGERKEKREEEVKEVEHKKGRRRKNASEEKRNEGGRSGNGKERREEKRGKTQVGRKKSEEEIEKGRGGEGGPVNLTVGTPKWNTTKKTKAKKITQTQSKSHEAEHTPTR